MKILPFRFYSQMVLGFDLDARDRSHLSQIMEDDAAANTLWKNYMDWHISLAPVERSERFGTWLKRHKGFQFERRDRATALDLINDPDFRKHGKLDAVIDYLISCNAHEDAFGAVERLWIMYRTR